MPIGRLFIEVEKYAFTQILQMFFDNQKLQVYQSKIVLIDKRLQYFLCR